VKSGTGTDSLGTTTLNTTAQITQQYIRELLPGVQLHLQSGVGEAHFLQQDLRKGGGEPSRVDVQPHRGHSAFAGGVVAPGALWKMDHSCRGGGADLDPCTSSQTREQYLSARYSSGDLFQEQMFNLKLQQKFYTGGYKQGSICTCIGKKGANSEPIGKYKEADKILKKSRK
jgi:hypothetical protein